MKRPCISISIVVLVTSLWIGAIVGNQNAPYSKNLEPNLKLVTAADTTIHINGNTNFTDYGFSGNGTANNPFLIENKIIDGNGSTCILINNTDAFFILQNCTAYNTIGGSTPGIDLVNVTNALIRNNTCYDNLYGVRVKGSHGNRVHNNTIYFNGVGILVEISTNINVTQNTLRINTWGVSLLFLETMHNLVANNTITNSNWHGIQIANAQNNTIFGNIIVNNTDRGISLEFNSPNNTISYNSIFDNNGTGIRLEGANNTVTWNAVHRNNQSIVEPLPGSNVIENNDYFAPTLTLGSVTPLYGNSSTLFTYSVTYTDLDNCSPTLKQVVIDSMIQDLSKQDGGDDTYTDGCIYVYTTTLTEGNHTHYFQMSDGTEVVQLPPTVPSLGPVVNYAPRLDPYLTTPTIGTTNTTFTFSVNYSDFNNDIPTVLNVTIDNTPFKMTKQNTSDLNYVDGCMYIYLTNLTVGNHSYSFQTSDGNDSVRLPTTGNFSGPYVNSPPNLTTGIVSPINGTTATVFTFTVNYSDVDNDEPSFVRLIINGTQYTMIKQNLTDVLFEDGCIYTHATLLSAGIYFYYFECDDGLQSFSLPIAGNTSGPLIVTLEPSFPIPSFSVPILLFCLIIIVYASRGGSSKNLPPMRIYFR